MLEKSEKTHRHERRETALTQRQIGTGRLADNGILR
jgi:hypothetical protein